MTTKLKAIALPPADSPAPFDIADVGALQALHQGRASDHQQRRALDWIMKKAGAIGGQSFRHGDPQATAFHEGRRFVAAQIIAILEIDVNKLKKGDANDS